jgi:hypothetical protein
MRKFEFKARERFSSWSQSAKTDRIFTLFVFFWALPLLLILVFTIVKFNDLPSQIPLLYSRAWGEEQLATREYIFLPLGGAILLGIFNLGLAVNFHTQDKVISYLLAGTATLVSILSSLTIFNIIKLVS